MNKLLRSVYEKKIPQVSAAYIGMCLLIVPALGVIQNTLDLNKELEAWSVFLLLIFFPIILVLTWELHSDHKNRKKRFVLYIIGTLVCGVGLLLATNHSRHTLIDPTPIIVGIYPSDSFGVLQAEGLRTSLQPVANEVRIVSLEAELAEMKKGRVDLITNPLEDALKQRNVIAIVGPPITEFAKPIVDLVQSINPDVPVLLTTAAPRSTVGWTEQDKNIFRVGSGIDERAVQFSTFISLLVSQGKNATILVEKLPASFKKTYGEVFFDYVSRNLDHWEQWATEGKIEVVYYSKENIISDIEQAGGEEIFNQPNLIFVFGLGDDLAKLVQHYYSTEANERKAMMGGWMTGYATEPALTEQSSQWQSIFEITDVFTPKNSNGVTSDLQRFHSRFGEATPSLRDQAIAFDSGLAILTAFRSVGDHDRNAKAIRNSLHEVDILGVSGRITFDENGQNLGQSVDAGNLHLTVFNPHTLEWNRIQGPAVLIENLR